MSASDKRACQALRIDSETRRMRPIIGEYCENFHLYVPTYSLERMRTRFSREVMDLFFGLLGAFIFCVLQPALKQFLVCFDPIEQHFNALFKIDFRFPAQFTFGLAEVCIKNALI